MKVFFTLALSTASLLLSLSAQAQTKDEYPLCQSFGFAVGEVPNLPLTARVEEGLRRIQPDGKSIHADSAPDSPAGLIVRDSSGRVMMGRENHNHSKCGG